MNAPTNYAPIHTTANGLCGSSGQVGPAASPKNPLLTAERDTPEIKRILGDLSEVQEVTGNLLAKLHSQLGPVLRKVPADTFEASPCPPTQTELGNALEDHCRRQRQFNDGIRHILSTLEL